MRQCDFLANPEPSNFGFDRIVTEDYRNTTMSSGATDDDQTLPESLQKLELVPVYERTPANEPNQNPFQPRTFSHRQNDEQVKLLLLTHAKCE